MKLRPPQENAVNFVEDAVKGKRKFIAVRGPTGVGKTCLGFESMTKPLFYICNSIQLQEQALKDYPEARLLKGRSHYPCKRYGSADLCIANKPCASCEYQRERKKAFKADMTVINFHYFLNAANFTQKFPLRNIIIDEADALETVLVDFISFDFTYQRMLALGITMDMPDRKTKIEVMPEWIKECLTKVIHKLSELANDVRDIRLKEGPLEEWELKTLRQYKGLNMLQWKLNLLTEQNLHEEWIFRYDDKRRTITLKPIWLSRELADYFLFSRGAHFLMMSATLPSKPLFCGMYGIEAEELGYTDLPNVWDNSKRNIYMIPSYSMTRKNKTPKTVKQMQDAIRRILEIEKGRGVIHAVSFELMKEIEVVSDRMITHNSKDKKEKFDQFTSKEGAVWLSPSSTRGIDLPDELCEFVIWPKAPFLSLGDPQVSARAYGGGKMGQLWYASDAIQTVVQGSGRGFRHEEDACNVYLLDEQIGRLISDNIDLFPEWYQGLIDWTSLDSLDEKDRIADDDWDV